MRPDELVQTFKMKQNDKDGKSFNHCNKMNNWADRVATWLGSRYHLYAERLNWFRRVAQSEEPAFQEGLNLEAIIDTLRRVGGGACVEPVEVPEVPPDQLVQLFPGADHPPMQVDALVTIEGVHVGKPNIPIPIFQFLHFQIISFNLIRDVRCSSKVFLLEKVPRQF